MGLFEDALQRARRGNPVIGVTSVDGNFITSLLPPTPKEIGDALAPAWINKYLPPLPRGLVGIIKGPSLEAESPEKEEECLPCKQMKDLKEKVARSKMDKALLELERTGDKQSVEIVRKWIEGQDIE